MPISPSKETIIRGISVILRVPSLFIAEAWYRTDPRLVHSNYLGKDKGNGNDKTGEVFVITAYYSTLLLALTLALLPLKKLVNFYMYMISACLLVIAHFASFRYVETERSLEYEGPVFDEAECIQRLALHLTGQCVISAIIAYLIDIKQWTKFILLVYTLPMFARLANFPIADLHRVHNFASTAMLLLIFLFVFNRIPIILDLLKRSFTRVSFSVQIYGCLPFLVAVWFKIMLPVQFLTFWLTLFVVQLYKYLSVEGGHPILAEGWIVVLLASIGECCVSPFSLLGLCFTVSYAAYLILNTTKFYLQGRDAFMQDNIMQSGWTEGFTMFLLALQTGMIDLKATQRAFLMSIILFIVFSSLIQSMYEITDPILLALGASHSRSILKHIRAIVLCTFLWIFPLYMTYMICQFFELDFWLLAIISSCVLTSVQVIGSMVVYALFLYDTLREEPWERLDDVVYYAKATTRVLEFIVAVFVVLYGVKESLVGQWSWINSSILIVHFYFNVWQRLQAGWKSYLLRREAVAKVESLPEASANDLENLNDVCAICFQEMKTARITPCHHFFHALCLRKWLYVQETCPMCHQKISLNNDMDDVPAATGDPVPAATGEPASHVPAGETGSHVPAGEAGDHHSDTEVPASTDLPDINTNTFIQNSASHSGQGSSQGNTVHSSMTNTQSEDIVNTSQGAFLLKSKRSSSSESGNGDFVDVTLLSAQQIHRVNSHSSHNLSSQGQSSRSVTQEQCDVNQSQESSSQTNSEPHPRDSLQLLFLTGIFLLFSVATIYCYME